MSPTIYASPRFSLLTAFAVMLGLVVAEVCVSAVIDLAYSLGPLTGLYVWAGDEPIVDAASVFVAKLLAFGGVTALVLRRSQESWRSLGHLGFAPPTLALAFLPIIAGTTIFLSEIDNLLRAFLPTTVLDGWDFAPELDRLMSAPWIGPALAVIIAPITEEVIFRGLILRGLLGRWKPWTAISAVPQREGTRKRLPLGRLDQAGSLSPTAIGDFRFAGGL
ncbi:MAG: CPBP family intramembrane metalloprotease [Opitutaceae bacterium]|nr:CPBP family intramembrane metalloprotease [Opitutaceae bacterium]